MNILSIETSCDDTSIAIVEAKGGFKRPCFNILSNVVSSQTKIHAPYGGVVPYLAARAHQRNLPVCLEEAFGKTNISSHPEPFNSIQDKLREGSRKRFFTSLRSVQNDIKIDLIAVTIGPGLEPSLWAGVNFAKSLSLISETPIIGVNHIEGHIYANWLPININKRLQVTSYKLQVKFPVLCLVVSGGHTQLILIKNYLKYQLLGETRDDAAGEAFDKVAKLLGLEYPGGPAISEMARKWKSQILNPKSQTNSKFKIQNSKFTFPRPMIYQKNYDFSFSGLKTAVLYKIKELGIVNPPFVKTSKSKQELRAEIAAEFQQAVIDVLISKTIRAAKEYKVETIMLGGGVAANEELRKQFEQIIKKQSPNSQFIIPDSRFCTDNAAMIGAAGYFRFLKNGPDELKNIKANANLRIV